MTIRSPWHTNADDIADAKAVEDFRAKLATGAEVLIPDSKADHVRLFLDLSTAHLSAKTVERMRSRPVYEWSRSGGVTRDGFFLHVDFAKGEEWADLDDIAACCEAARTLGCDYILFDTDAEEMDGLPVYDDDDAPAAPDIYAVTDAAEPPKFLTEAEKDQALVDAMVMIGTFAAGWTPLPDPRQHDAAPSRPMLDPRRHYTWPASAPESAWNGAPVLCSVSPDELERFKAVWLSAGRPLIVMDYAYLPFSAPFLWHRPRNLNDVREEIWEQICAAFAIPASVISRDSRRDQRIADMRKRDLALVGRPDRDLRYEDHPDLVEVGRETFADEAGG